MEEKFVGLVKRYPVLYNTKLPQYKDSFKRNSAWVAIANAMNLSVVEVKIKWNKLRNSFNNALKRRHNKAIQGSKALPPWRFETEMSFLIPFIENKETGMSYQPSSPLPDNIELETVLSNHSFESNSTFTPKQTTSRSKDENVWTNETQFEDLFEVPESQQNTTLSVTNDMDETDLLFLSMSRTLKKLPKLEQCRIKLDLFKTVQEAEIAQLERERVLKMPTGVIKNNKFVFCSAGRVTKSSKAKQRRHPEDESIEVQEENENSRPAFNVKVDIEEDE